MADAETTLRELLEIIAKDFDYRDPAINISAISSGGANYTSILFVATLKDDKKEEQLFVKTANIAQKMRAIINAERIYKTEAFFYKSLAKIYYDLQDKYDVPKEERLVFPKFYGCDLNLHQETIVMENLVAKGYGTYDRTKSMDWEHASCAVEVLAKFHALSFAYEKDNPEEFATVIEKFMYRRPEVKQDTKGTLRRMAGRSLSVIKREYAERLRRFFASIDEDLFEKYSRPVTRPVLIHADYRISNLMFKKQGDHLHTIPVDFQNLRSGCPATDLVYLIFLGSDQQFRAEHYSRLLDHYHHNLALALARFNVDAAAVYPRELFDREMKEILPFALLISVVILPMVLVDAELAPRFGRDDIGFDVGELSVAPTERFAERLLGIIEDFERWGVLPN